MSLRFLHVGNWSTVSAQWTANGRRIVPEVESAIEQAWTTAMARPGVHLFDGPMCRLESWQATDNLLSLTLSRSSYKPFLGTNMAHPEFADLYGSQVMGNPVGVSTALSTSDGRIVLGRRNAAVAYYPGRVHPFAGCMEPIDADVFAAVTRELREELSLTDAEVSSLRCTGIVEDLNLRQRELIFAANLSMTIAQIESRVDRSEHTAIWSVPATAEDIQAAAMGDRELTPVAVASLLLWGRQHFGTTWFKSSEEKMLSPNT